MKDVGERIIHKQQKSWDRKSQRRTKCGELEGYLIEYQWGSVTCPKCLRSKPRTKNLKDEGGAESEK